MGQKKCNGKQDFVQEETHEEHHEKRGVSDLLSVFSVLIVENRRDPDCFQIVFSPVWILGGSLEGGGLRGASPPVTHATQKHLLKEKFNLSY